VPCAVTSHTRRSPFGHRVSAAISLQAPRTSGSRGPVELAWLAGCWLAGSLAGPRSHGSCARSCAHFGCFFLSFGCFLFFLCIVPHVHFLVSSSVFLIFLCSVSPVLLVLRLPHGATRAKRKLQAHATGDGRYRLFEAEAPSAGILALQRGKSSPKSERRNVFNGTSPHSTRRSSVFRALIARSLRWR